MQLTRRGFFFSALCVVASFYWACSSKSNPVGAIPLSVSSPYYPLAKGDTWTYSVLEDTNGVGSPAFLTSTEIVGEQSFNGYLGYTLGEPGYDFSLDEYMVIDGHGDLLEFLDTSSGAGLGQWQQITDFSDTIIGKVDTMYADVDFGAHGVSVPPEDEGTIFFETYMGDTTITVEAGTFTAAYYRDSSGYTEYGVNGWYTLTKSFYAKGAGLVWESEEYYAPTQATPYIAEYEGLAKYTVH